MKKRITKLLITGIMLVVSSSMVGCTPVNDIAVKFGFKNEGVSSSVHGGVVWYQMRLEF